MISLIGEGTFLSIPPEALFCVRGAGDVPPPIPYQLSRVLFGACEEIICMEASVSISSCACPQASLRMLRQRQDDVFHE